MWAYLLLPRSTTDTAAYEGYISSINPDQFSVLELPERRHYVGVSGNRLLGGVFLHAVKRGSVAECDGSKFGWLSMEC